MCSPSSSTSLTMSLSSASVGRWPSERMTTPSSVDVIRPSPSLSNRLNASWNSAICSSARPCFAYKKLPSFVLRQWAVTIVINRINTISKHSRFIFILAISTGIEWFCSIGEHPVSKLHAFLGPHKVMCGHTFVGRGRLTTSSLFMGVHKATPGK
jgi:hypothetical protein